MKWISKETCYTSAGKKAFKFGDTLPQDVISSMGEATLKEYMLKKRRLNL